MRRGLAFSAGDIGHRRFLDFTFQFGFDVRQAPRRRPCLRFLPWPWACVHAWPELWRRPWAWRPCSSAPAALAGRPAFFLGGLGGGGGIGVRGGLGLARGLLFSCASAFFNNSSAASLSSWALLLGVDTVDAFVAALAAGRETVFSPATAAGLADFAGFCTGMDNLSVKKGHTKKTQAPWKPAHGAHTAWAVWKGNPRGKMSG